MPELQVIAHHDMKPGEEDAVLALLPRLIEATRAEPGCISFDAYRKLDEPGKYVLLERYDSREAFAAHRESAHFEEFVLGGIAPRLERRVWETFDVVE
jgi:quinol monooxygenase YgiN